MHGHTSLRSEAETNFHLCGDVKGELKVSVVLFPWTLLGFLVLCGCFSLRLCLRAGVGFAVTGSKSLGDGAGVGTWGVHKDGPLSGLGHAGSVSMGAWLVE